MMNSSNLFDGIQLFDIKIIILVENTKGRNGQNKNGIK